MLSRHSEGFKGDDVMSRIRYALLGLVLIGLAGCGTANKESTENQPAVAPAPPQAAPESTAQVAAPEPSTPAPSPTVSRQAATKPSAPKSVQKAAPPAPAEESQPAQQVQARETAATAPSAHHAAEAPAAPKVQEPKYVTIPTGANLQVRLQEPLSSAANQQGDQFVAILDKDIEVNGIVVARRGCTVEGKVAQVERSGRVKGRASMSLQLVNLIVENQPYPLQTEDLSFEAESTKKKDAAKVGIGAGLGAVIGAIAGGGKGAGIGAAVGAGAGGATVMATRGEEVKFEAEHVLSFVLQHEVSIKLR